MLSTDLFAFTVSDDDLSNSPSRQDGIDEESECYMRMYGCEIVQESGILLKLPQVVMATGQVLFHRFFCKKSFKEYSPEIVAGACLYLAAKLEEQTKLKARAVLVVLDRVTSRREGRPLTVLEPGGKEYDRMRLQLIKHERLLLKEFGFVTMVEHPHKYVFNLMEMVAKKGREEQILPGHACHPLLQEAWSLLNDSYRTTLCVRFKAVEVACGVIFMAARRLKMPLPENPPWWEVCEVAAVDIYKVCRALHNLYQMPKVDSATVAQILGRKAQAAPATPSTGPVASEPSPAPADADAGATQPRQGSEPQPVSVERPELGPSPALVGNGAASGGLTGDKPTRSGTAGGEQQEPQQQPAPSQQQRPRDSRDYRHSRSRSRDRSGRGRSRSTSRDRSKPQRSRSRGRDRSRRERERDGCERKEPSRQRERPRDHKEQRHRDRGYDRERGRSDRVDGERERYSRPERERGGYEPERDGDRERSRGRDRERDGRREYDSRQRGERERKRALAAAAADGDAGSDRGGKRQASQPVASPRSSPLPGPPAAEQQQQQQAPTPVSKVQQRDRSAERRSPAAPSPASGRAGRTPPDREQPRQQPAAPNTGDSGQSPAVQNGLPLPLPPHLSSRLERAGTSAAPARDEAAGSSRGRPARADAEADAPAGLASPFGREVAAAAAAGGGAATKHTDLREKFRQFESAKAGAALPPAPGRMGARQDAKGPARLPPPPQRR